MLRGSLTILVKARIGTPKCTNETWNPMWYILLDAKMTNTLRNVERTGREYE